MAQMLLYSRSQAGMAACTGQASSKSSAQATPPTRTRPRKVRTVGGFFLARVETQDVPMKQVIASLRTGNWKALLACFLYFDTGFTVWVMFGPLAPYISKQLSLTPVAVGLPGRGARC